MASDNARSDNLDQAITVMFKSPALQYSRFLRTRLDKDPDFVKRHEAEVLPELVRLLREAGILLDEGNGSDQLRRVIREVVIRLRSYEKGKE